MSEAVAAVLDKCKVPDGLLGQIVAIVEKDYASSDTSPAAIIGQVLCELAIASAQGRALAQAVITAVA